MIKVSVSRCSGAGDAKWKHCCLRLIANALSWSSQARVLPFCTFDSHLPLEEDPAIVLRVSIA
jgi:hypothetical protein